MTGALGQVVVLCGGRGSRLGGLLGDLPKVLAPVAGRPLLQHLLDDLAAAGAAEVLLVAGYGADRLAAALPAIAPGKLPVQLFVEPEPRGTAGALRAVAGLLQERFLLVYGDVYAALDFGRFGAAARANGGLATLVVHRSSHPEDSDVIALDDAHRIVAWVGRRPEQREGAVVLAAALTNAAIGEFSHSIIDYIPKDRPCDLYDELLPALIDARADVHGYLSSEYVRDIGTPKRLTVVDERVRRGTARLRAELVLLDRDGVLCVDAPQPSALELLPGAAVGTRLLNEAGIRVAVVTNQAAVARGLCTPEQLEREHARLAELLQREGARLDAVYACPHHPETGHADGIDALRGPCRCRKPSVGMVVDALDDLGVEPWRALVIGDASIDMQLAHNAGLPGIGLSTGKGLGDGRFPAQPVWRFADLESAARWITGLAEA